MLYIFDKCNIKKIYICFIYFVIFIYDLNKCIYLYNPLFSLLHFNFCSTFQETTRRTEYISLSFSFSFCLSNSDPRTFTFLYIVVRVYHHRAKCSPRLGCISPRQELEWMANVGTIVRIVLDLAE